MITKIQYYIEYDTGKKVHDEYGLFNNFRNRGLLGHYIYKLYDDNGWLSLLDIFSQMLSNEEYELVKHDRKKQFQITMDYLSPLLLGGELKMKTFEQYKKQDFEGKDGFVINSIYPGKEWFQGEIEEGIKYVIEKWNSIDNNRERESFEDFGVIFTLAENEWVI